uniref:MADS-box domain-containing protein n=1 Tax=Leersia perrieri TaxID=77586 RepID=A0A0D9UXH9_9ORYZ
MVGPSGRSSKGKKEIEIKLIENTNSRHVTFSKRRSGLFKKASELSTLCGAAVAVVAFSQAGRPFAFLSDPTADSLLRRRSSLVVTSCAGGEEVDAMRRAAEEAAARHAAEKARMSDAADKIVAAAAAAGSAMWWESAGVEALGEAELAVLDVALRRLKGDVCHRLSNAGGVASARRRRRGSSSLSLKLAFCMLHIT